MIRLMIDRSFSSFLLAPVSEQVIFDKEEGNDMTRLMMIVMLFFCSSLAMASGKVAVVNFEEAIMGTDLAQSKLDEAKNDRSFKLTLDQAQKIQEEGRQLAEKHQRESPTMSTSERRELEKKIQEKQEDLEHVAGQLQEMRNQLLQGILQEMNETATQVTRELIESEKIGLLLNANPQIVLHAEPDFDITAKVTDRLNRIHNQD